MLLPVDRPNADRLERRTLVPKLAISEDDQKTKENPTANTHSKPHSAMKHFSTYITMHNILCVC